MKLSKEERLKISKYVRSVNSFRNELCSICRERVCNIATSCYLKTGLRAHRFHKDCIDMWKDGLSCPNCRTDLSDYKNSYVYLNNPLLTYNDIIIVLNNLTTADITDEGVLRKKISVLFDCVEKVDDWVGVIFESFHSVK